MINYRYSKGSAIAITTNKGVASWPSVLADDEVLAGAILDRLLHNATVLNIQGRSYRLKELDAQLQQQAATRSGSSLRPARDAAASVAATSEPTSLAALTTPSPPRETSVTKI